MVWKLPGCMYNRASWKLLVKQADGLKLPKSVTRQYESYLVVQLNMQFPCNNIKLHRVNRNSSAVHQRTDVCLFLHLHSGQRASHSKTSVPARGLLCGKYIFRLRNWMTRCATGCPVAQRTDLGSCVEHILTMFGHVLTLHNLTSMCDMYMLYYWKFFCQAVQTFQTFLFLQMYEKHVWVTVTHTVR